MLILVGMGLHQSPSDRQYCYQGAYYQLPLHVGWYGQVVQFRCDNQAVVAILWSITSRDPNFVHILRCLAFFEAYCTFKITTAYLPGPKSFISIHAESSPLQHPALQHKTGLDIQSESGLASSTKSTYKAGINKFNQFCFLYEIANPLPVSQYLLCLFISHLLMCPCNN